MEKLICLIKGHIPHLGEFTTHKVVDGKVVSSSTETLLVCTRCHKVIK